MINFNNIKYSNNLLLFNNLLKSKNSYFFCSNHIYSNNIYNEINQNNDIIISHSSLLNHKIKHINFIKNYTSSPHNYNNVINILITDKHIIKIDNYDLVFYSNKKFNNNFKNFFITNNKTLSNANLLINIIYFNIYISSTKLFIFDYKSLLIYDTYDEYIYNYNLFNDFIKWAQKYIKIIFVESDTLYRINNDIYNYNYSRNIILYNNKLNEIILNKKIPQFLNRIIHNLKLKSFIKNIINRKKNTNKNSTINSSPKIKQNRNINTKTINNKNLKKYKNKNYDNNYLNSINY